MTDHRTPDLETPVDPTAANSADTLDAAADRGAEGRAPDAADSSATEAADPLAEAQREVAEQKDKYLRLYAEFENFRKRAVRDRLEAEKMGMGAVMKGLLETLDDLGRVSHMTPEGADAKSVLEGVAMVEKKLLKSLAGHGLEAVNPVDAPFDPNLHEAISTAPAANADEDNLVAVVYQIGYVLNGTLLRPARVVVKQWNG
ncbi:MAG TPA: nucleotide exchange factor GrpE [Gemmatimonadaceae bacterium]|nr:nucleotide exchange factor GrpE [Gemmatimonadaceae bacterium]